MKLDQMTVIITGASCGIGASIATELASKNSNIVVNYNTNQQAAEAVIDTIERAGGRTIMVQADLSHPDQATHLYEQATNHFGQVDAIVHGATPPLLTGDALTTAYTDIQHYMDVYVGAFLALAQLTLPGMIDRRLVALLLLVVR